MNPILKSLIAFLLISVYSLNPIHAQNIEMKWGEKGKRSTFTNPLTGETENSAQTIRIFDEDETYYYALRRRISKNPVSGAKYDYYLDQYDLSHKLFKSEELSLKTPKGRYGKFEAIYAVGNKHVLFFSYWDQMQKENTLYATRIENDGKQGLPFIVDKEEIRDQELGLYRYDLSSDSLNLLITRLDGYSYKKNATRKLKLRVLNQNIESSWERDVVLSHNDYFMKFNDCLFTDSGSIFLAYSYTDKNKRIFNNIIAYNTTTAVLEDVSIGSNTTEIDNVNMFCNQKDKLSLIGFQYQEKEVLSGIYSGSMNMQTFALENEVVNPFHPDTIAKYFSKKVQARAMGVRPKYAITDIIIKKDGSLLLITENRANQGVASSIQGVQYVDRFYGFLEFMIIKLDASGKIVWTVDIPKYQFGNNDLGEYGSFIMDYDKETIYLLYNDDPKNMLLNSKKGWRNEKGLVEEFKLKKVHEGRLILVKVSSNGIATREFYKDNNGKNDVIIRPANARRMKDGRIWLVGEEKDTYMYGFLELN